MNRAEPEPITRYAESASGRAAPPALVAASDPLYLRMVKPAVDRLLAALLLLPAAPLLAACLLLVWLTSGRPLLYRPRLVGRGGRQFRGLKLRTMVRGAEQELERLLTEHDHEASHTERGKLRHDPRVTRLGSLLRRSSLDELPQLLNVLRGEMSVVGPRPLPPAELAQRYGAAAPALLRVKPGLTGLWQVSGRSLLTYAERIDLDLWYAAHAGPLLDLRILLRTPLAVLSGRGAW